MTSRNLFLLLALLGISSIAFAQANEVSLTVGGMPSSSDVKLPGVCPVVFMFSCPSGQIQTGPGFAIQATYARRILSFKPASISFELPALLAPNRAVTGTQVSGTTVFVRGNFHSSAFFFTPSVKVNLLPSLWISPFGSVGGGLAHYGNASDDNVGALHFGGGIDIKTPLRFFTLRGEVRDFYSKRPSFEQQFVGPNAHQHNLFAGAGLVFHF